MAVQNCDLGGLPDLNTGSPYVQSQLSGYLNDLASLGVAGLRLDAAKHINPADLQAILSRLQPVNGTGAPLYFNQVPRPFPRLPPRSRLPKRAHILPGWDAPLSLPYYTSFYMRSCTVRVCWTGEGLG